MLHMCIVHTPANPHGDSYHIHLFYHPHTYQMVISLLGLCFASDCVLAMWTYISMIMGITNTEH